MKGINLCGECGYYDWKNHKCSRGASKDTDPKSPFYEDCPLDEVVPVVRCKDCKHHVRTDTYTGKIFDFAFCSKFRNITKPTDFCSYGKRRDHE